jgi:hypothetical protein
MERIAARLARESGGTELRALADMKAAIQVVIDRTVDMRYHVGFTSFGGASGERATWKEIGEDLGVSAQAAHRRYR